MSSRAQQGAEAACRKDPRLWALKKQFAKNLLAALTQFEKAEEWSDLIHCLELVKRVMAAPKLAEIPLIPSTCVITFAKRLGQCLHASLPDGVHLRALEIYRMVFRRLDTKLFLEQISLWSLGIFPLFQFASMRVRPVLLSLMEDFYQPCGRGLVPVLDGLFVALAPGLEEEGSEFYSPTLKFLLAVCDLTGRGPFMHAVWRCLLVCPQCRLATVNFLVASLPRNDPEALVRYLPQPQELAVRALTATMNDTNILAQRKVLELLTHTFPLNRSPFREEEEELGAAVLQRVPTELLQVLGNSVLDRKLTVSLLIGALELLMRRDVSLSRRVLSWLLNDDFDRNSKKKKKQENKKQLPRHSLAILVVAFLTMTTDLDDHEESSSKELLSPSLRYAKPFQLMLCLLDRPEIKASSILEHVQEPLLRFIYRYHSTHPTLGSFTAVPAGLGADDDLKQMIAVEFAALKAANAFYANVRVSPIWRRLGTLLTGLLHKKAEPEHIIQAVAFLDFSFDFLPFHLDTTGTSSNSSNNNNSDNSSSSSNMGSIEEAEKEQKEREEESMMLCDIFPALVKQLLEVAHSFAQAQSFAPLESVMRLVLKVVDKTRMNKAGSGVQLAPTVLDRLVTKFSELAVIPPDDHVTTMEALHITFQLFNTLLSLQHRGKRQQQQQQHDDTKENSIKEEGKDAVRMQNYLEQVMSRYALSEIDAVSCIGVDTVLEILFNFPSLANDAIQQSLAQRLWAFLDARTEHFHLTASRYMFDCCVSVGGAAACAAVAVASLTAIKEKEEEEFARFTILWHYFGQLAPPSCTFLDAPLALMLDALEDARPRVRVAARIWLTETLEKRQVARVIDPLLHVLLDNVIVGGLAEGAVYAAPYDVKRVAYTISKLSAIVSCDQGLFTAMSSSAYFTKPALLSRLGAAHRMDYTHVLALTLLRFVQGSVSEKEANPDFQAANTDVQSAACELLQALLSPPAQDFYSQRHNGMPRHVREQLAILLVEPVLCLLTSILGTRGSSLMELSLLGLLGPVLMALSETPFPVMLFSLSSSDNRTIRDIVRGYGLRYGPLWQEIEQCQSLALNPKDGTVAVSIHHLFSSSVLRTTVLLGFQSQREEEDSALLSVWISFVVSTLVCFQSSRALHKIVVPILGELTQEVGALLRCEQTSLNSLGILFDGIRALVHFCLFGVGAKKQPITHQHQQQVTVGVTTAVVGASPFKAKQRFRAVPSSAFPVMVQVASPHKQRPRGASRVSRLATVDPLVANGIALFDERRHEDEKGEGAGAETRAAEAKKKSSSGWFGFGKGSSSSSSSSSSTAEKKATKQKKSSASLARAAVFRAMPLLMESCLRVWSLFSSFRPRLLQLLQPVMLYYPEVVVDALLHTWEKELSDSLTCTPQQPQSPPPSSPLPQGRNGILRCPHLGFVIDMLNQLDEASPHFVIGALVPRAIELFRCVPRGKENNGSGGDAETAPVTVPALRVHETVALHFLDVYMKLCVRPSQLHVAWPALNTLIRQALRQSNHPFTFLWLLGILQLYVRRAAATRATAATTDLTEAQELSRLLLERVSIMAGNNRLLIQPTYQDTLVPLPSIINYAAPRDDDEDFLPPLASWLRAQQEQQLHEQEQRRQAINRNEEVAPNVLVSYTADACPVALIALRSLSNVLAILVADVNERGGALLARTLAEIVPILHNHRIDNVLYVSAAVTVLSSLSVTQYKWTLAYWKKEAWDLFMDERFFLTNTESLSQWRWVVKRIVSEDKSALAVILDRSWSDPALGFSARLVGTSNGVGDNSSSSFSDWFSSREVTLTKRAGSVKRLAFILHSGRRDQYARHLSFIMDKLVESLKIAVAAMVPLAGISSLTTSQADSTRLHQCAKSLYAQVLFCMRVLMARVSPEHLSTVWPIALMEIIKILQDKGKEEVFVLLAACKFVDMAVVLLPSHFALYKWMFVTAAMQANQGQESGFTPYLLVNDQQHKANEEKKQEHEEKEEYPTPPQLAHLAVQGARPVLGMRTIRSAADLAPFYSRLQRQSDQCPDLNYIDELLLSDFVEFADNSKHNT